MQIQIFPRCLYLIGDLIIQVHRACIKCKYLQVKIHSGLNLSQRSLIFVNLFLKIYRLFSVLKIIRSHSSRVFLFLFSISCDHNRDFKIANSCVLLVGQPYKEQLQPTILVFNITLKV
jgi:hypothetical protein